MSRMSDIEEIDPLLQRTRMLNPAVEPPDDLWPGIRKRLAERVRSPWTTSRLAVAAVLLVGISSALTLLIGGELRKPVSLDKSNTAYVEAELQHRAMGPQFVQARTDLVLSLEKELEELSPVSRKVLAENLNSIDEAITQINVALEDNPNSGLLLHLLLSTYTDQLTLLGTIDGMTRTANESERTQL